MKLLRGFVYFLATLGMYLGVSLLGWGLGDLAGFFSSAPRAAYAAVAALFALAVGYQAIDDPEGISGGKGEKAKTVSRQTVLGGIMTSVLFAALFALPLAERDGFRVFGGGPAVRWVGAALSLAGYGLVFWSGRLLGRFYSAQVTLQEGHRLVTAGVYGAIRHPRYLGVLLLALGVALVFRSWIGLALFAVTLGFLLLRIHDEEAFMYREFGEEWETYCQRTRRLVPGVW
jgi:protein-S-isoprenylcysteine O-methyltransferase Ste14